MPIKSIVATLALASILCFSVRGPVSANPDARAVGTDAVSTTAALLLNKAAFRIVTTSPESFIGQTVTSGPSSLKPKDLFRATVTGIQLQSGDKISLTFSGPDGTVDIGSPTFDGTNPFLTLSGKRARGTLGEAPYIWSKAIILFNPKANRMIFLALRGTAQATPVITSLNGATGLVTENVPVTVGVNIRRNSTDCTISVGGNMRVRHNINRRLQLDIYRGDLRQ